MSVFLLGLMQSRNTTQMIRKTIICQIYINFFSLPSFVRHNFYPLKPLFLKPCYLRFPCLSISIHPSKVTYTHFSKHFITSNWCQMFRNFIFHLSFFFFTFFFVWHDICTSRVSLSHGNNIVTLIDTKKETNTHTYTQERKIQDCRDYSN